MKAKVLSTFKDVNKKKYLIGDIIEISEERAKVLLGDNVYKKAFVEIIEEDKKDDVVKEDIKDVKKVEKDNKKDKKKEDKKKK